jgi:membrane associated rhomboid family serine protease
MVLPLYDENPFQLPRTPWVTWSLISTNVLIFLTQIDPLATHQIASGFKLVPAAFLMGSFASLFTSISYMFLHDGWGHLFGNMLFLFIFGDDVEMALGSVRYLFFYFASGILGGIAYVALNQHSTTGLAGASGAIAAVLVAYLMIRPCARVMVMVPNGFIRTRAYWFVGVWLGVQLLSLAINLRNGVAYVAHVGGGLAGSLFLLMFQPANVSLFQCNDSENDEVASALISSVPILAFLFILTAILLLTR